MSPRLRISSLAAVAVSTSFSLACGSADEETVVDEGRPPHESGLPWCDENIDARNEPCVDDLGAMICPADTGWPGDGLALCEPEADQGMVLHYGPTDWDDPDHVAHFHLEPGGDDENCTYLTTPNETDVFVNSYYGRMRPGSHHLIMTTLDTPVEDQPLPTTCSEAGAAGSRWLVGSQDPQIDVAVGGSAGPEGMEAKPGDPDYHLGQKIAARTGVRYDMHYTNPTDELIVREAWVGFNYAAESEIDNLVDMITFFKFGLFIPAKTKTVTPRTRCEAPSDRYIGLLTGHFHALGARFSVWKEDAAGNEELVYETYDWADPGNLYYRDGVENPSPNAAAGTMGGSSGYLHVAKGEALTFECEFNNFRDNMVRIGTTAEDEMCNVFGMYYPTDGDVWNCTAF